MVKGYISSPITSRDETQIQNISVSIQITENLCSMSRIFFNKNGKRWRNMTFFVLLFLHCYGNFIVRYGILRMFASFFCSIERVTLRMWGTLIWEALALEMPLWAPGTKVSTPTMSMGWVIWPRLSMMKWKLPTTSWCKLLTQEITLKVKPLQNDCFLNC